jgi:hypothetical protein
LLNTKEITMWDTILAEALGQPGIAEKSKKTLLQQTIGENQPGTILRDFTALVEFIGEDGLKTSGKYFMLPQAKLSDLNEQMSHPVAHRLKRPQQRSFPHLHGLFLILRASGMGVTKGQPPSGRLMIDEEMVANWLDLNATERYFTLLESWLVQGSPKIIGEREGWLDRGLLSTLISVAQKLGQRRTVVSDERYDVPHGTMDYLTVALMELFGWVLLEYRNPEEGEGVKLAAVEGLPLGDAMLSALMSERLSGRGLRLDERSAGPGVLQPLFQPYFPQWQRNLKSPEQPYREGAHTWRVSLGKVWRRIVAPADMDLDDLAMAILDAFDFDDDHLYCFELPDRRGRTLRIACGYEEDAAMCTEDVRLGDVSLPVGGTMTFVFDYGDEWHFNVKLESVGEKKSRLKRPKVTAKGGKAPAQYNWEEW